MIQKKSLLNWMGFLNHYRTIVTPALWTIHIGINLKCIKLINTKLLEGLVQCSVLVCEKPHHLVFNQSIKYLYSFWLNMWNKFRCFILIEIVVLFKSLFLLNCILWSIGSKATNRSTFILWDSTIKLPLDGHLFHEPFHNS